MRITPWAMLVIVAVATVLAMLASRNDDEVALHPETIREALKRIVE